MVLGVGPLFLGLFLGCLVAEAAVFEVGLGSFGVVIGFSWADAAVVGTVPCFLGVEPGAFFESCSLRFNFHSFI